MAESADRRNVERMPVGAGTECSFVGRIIEDIGPVKVRDVSMQGVGLVLLKPVEIGSLLAIGLTKADRGFAKTLMVRVIHCTPIVGGHMVGGEFLEPLTYQELTTLVL